MKNQSFFIAKQNGFFLPYVLFLTAVVLIVLTTTINTYKSDLQITDNQLKQLKIETLFQMGRTKFKQNFFAIETDPDRNQVHYTFPDGNVSISYVHLIDKKYELTFTIHTNKKSYITTDILSLE
ncbi:hypothetical protein [Virgibacillus ndiopensis]|uniref:hypothetical protein n=1 Tax=Virgibacillus ndiopensis TaxID=2004408 RepID=UPI000C0860EE|nr:hypothetical protein [Virgibacillus ndiopensis]